MRSCVYLSIMPFLHLYVTAVSFLDRHRKTVNAIPWEALDSEQYLFLGGLFAVLGSITVALSLTWVPNTPRGGSC